MKTQRNFYLMAALCAVAFVAAVAPDLAAAAVQSVVSHVGAENLTMLSLFGTTATTVIQGDTYTGKYPVNTQPRDSGIYPITLPIAFPAAAPVANDLHLLCRLLPGVEIVDYTIDLEDHDSSTGSSISIGEANAGITDLGVVWKSGITQGQAGGLLRYAAASDATRLSTVQATNLATERVIALKWDTAATTYVASKKGLIVLWARG